MSGMVRAPGSGGADDSRGSIEWRRSSRSYGAGECVEVAARCGEHIDVRDSKNPEGSVLRFTPAEWHAFTAAIRVGRSDLYPSNVQ